ncbi:MAG: type I DNA topoisomerase [Minisyncoccia bacterium]
MTKLVIVESPSKAKTIEKYLGEDYRVVASVGHVRDLPKSNKKAIDIEGGFIPHYEISKGKEHIIEDIKKLAKKADEVLLATDPDREGEAIAWHIAEVTKLLNPKRIVFHEITKDAVLEAIKHPREIDEKLKIAQEARRVLDRLVGYDLSGLIWKKVRYGLSAGRVQSPALRILVEREREIKKFISHPFFIIHGNFKNGKNEQFECESNEILDEKEVEKIVANGKKADWSVSSVDETKVMRAPRAPFTTSTLQQAASTRLGFSPSNTMRIAQKLYEKGLITYMRTDSTNLGSQALGMIKGAVEKEYGANMHQFRTFKTKSKNAQEAHEAIRPTDFKKKSAGIAEDEKKLYKLIWARTVASQMNDAETMRTTIIVGAKDLPDLKAVGTRVINDGWLLADPNAKGEDVILPHVNKDEKLKTVSIESERKETTPPPRYSEAGLVKELEKRGIGRPSTYASIIKTLLDREYVTKEARSLKPTDTGEVVSTFLEDNFAKYISDTFTAEMENELDEIADGTRQYKKTLTDFYKPFSKDVEEKSTTAKITTLGDADAHHICPKCGSSMIIKLSRGGRFLSCSRFPNCDGALTIEGKEIQKDKPIGEDPETGLPIFVKTGRFGPYVQVGEDVKGKKTKPKRASIPKDKDVTTVSIEDALKYLALPRVLGNYPETGEPITASVGRFGPYIVHQKDFRSLKTDSPYEISLERATEILKEPKKVGRGRFAKKKDK